MPVFVYVNTSKQVGDPEHIKVFANADAAEKWFEDCALWRMPGGSSENTSR
jgi:hypothetical protein